MRIVMMLLLFMHGLCAWVAAGRVLAQELPPIDDAPPPELEASDLGPAIDEWLSRMEPYGLHGAVLVVKDGREILKRGYGIADHDAGARITHETIFDIGSLAKQFTAAAVLILEMRSSLRVEDTIAKHLDDVPEDKQDITIHQLLTHSAGLPYHADPSLDMLEQPLESKPGERFAYSNVGYAILADIVEAASGEPFEAFVEENIFRAAGLDRTGFRGRLELPAEQFARAYTDTTAQMSAADPMSSDGYRGAGGVVSCVEDLYAWEKALVLGGVLSDEAREKFFAEHVRNEGEALGYAYGWMTIRTTRGTRLVLHGGNFGGFNCDYRRYIDEGTTIVFLSNHFTHGRSMRDAVVNDISRFVNGTGEEQRYIPQPPVAVSLVSSEHARIQGEFALPSGETITLEPGGDGRSVIARPSGQESLCLLASPWMRPRDWEFVRQCNDTAVAVMNAAFNHDSAPLEEAISPALPFAGAWDALRDLLRDLELQHGAFESCHARGTALLGGSDAGRTWLALQFAAGAADVAMTFSGGIVHFERTAPPHVTFQTISNDTLAFYNIFNAEESIIEIDDDTDGTVLAIKIETGLTERVRATRLDV